MVEGEWSEGEAVNVKYGWSRGEGGRNVLCLSTPTDAEGRSYGWSKAVA